MILAAGSVFDPIYNFFGAILAFFYGIIPNLGVSIILLTVLVMLVMFPLTAKQAKSMMAMQRAQPEIKKLQAKYKNDRAKLNEEMMKFYQENKINPLAGCLPLLVQMPVFLALFHVMRDPYKHIPKGSDLYAAFCTGPAGKLHTANCNLPKSGLPNPQEFLGMNLSQHATGVAGGFLDALPYFILVGLVIVTGFLQARQSRRNAPNMNKQMAMITTILPIGFGLFSLQFPAGLVLYFLVSNLWRLGQQELIMRKITRPGQAAIAASAAKRRRHRREGSDTARRRSRARRAACGSCSSSRPPPTARAGRSERGDERRRTAPRSRRRRSRPRREAGRREGRARQGLVEQAPRSPATSGAWHERGHSRARTTRSASDADARSRRTVLTGSGEQVPLPNPKRANTMEWVETTGRTIAEALDAALDELGVDEDDVEYEVLEEPKSGFLGRLGSSEGRIRARVKPISREKPGERQRRKGRGSSRPRGGNGGRSGATADVRAGDRPATGAGTAVRRTGAVAVAAVVEAGATAPAGTTVERGPPADPATSATRSRGAPWTRPSATYRSRSRPRRPRCSRRAWSTPSTSAPRPRA